MKQAFTTGLTSAATVGAISALGKLGSAALKKLPTRIYSYTSKLDKETANVLMNERQMGTLGKLKAISDKNVAELNQSIASKITEESGEFSSKEFINKVYKSIRNDWQGYSKKKIADAMKNAGIDPFLKGETVNYKIADNVRKGIGETIGTAWRTDNPKFNHSVRMKIWKEIVNTIRPATNTSDEFARLAAYTKSSMKFGKILSNQEKKFGIGLYDLLGGGIGYAGGGAPGAAAVAISRRTLESPLVGSTISVGLNELNKVISKIPTDSAGKISRTALIDALKNIQ